MNQLSIEAVEKMARERGLKMTPQRRAIIRFLQTAKNHPTPEEVLRAVNKEFPMASRATVYNTINWLKKNKMLKEIFEAGQVRLDPNCKDHHHFICKKCGKVEDVDFDLIPSLNLCNLPNSNRVESFELIMRGLCKECKNLA
ncbi:MAG: transcriptional repressor [Acidobacteria bacterium]|jgi:Fe2+ or Zn2+ uptake regulation protein|nr:MAG: transcriptional repressor [Acidobacteriota bacterium]GIU82098.1 MAG: transcriptional repressor [Pyrinomonadaceae bacterium]